MNLPEFLLARISEDEARLRKAERPWSAPHDPDCDYYPGDTPCTCNLLDRLLAECEAKRRIVELHGGTFAENGSDRYLGDTCYECREDAMHPCLTTRLLALPFADHPDHREEWKP